MADVLRVYEEFSDEGENLGPLNRAMNIAERLLLIAYIDGFYREDPSRLGQGLFITDGPLALYGPMAPMKSKFLSYWEQLCHDLDRRDIAAPLLVGIEKTGRFVDHARAIQDHIKPGHVMVLDTPYINQYIVNQKSEHFYGQDEFYGRRFFYRTTTGEVLVVTVPRLPGGRPYEPPRTRRRRIAASRGTITAGSCSGGCWARLWCGRCWLKWSMYWSRIQRAWPSS